MSAHTGIRRTLGTMALTIASAIGAIGASAAELRQEVGTPFAGFNESQALAVDQATGNVYVGEGGQTSTVRIFGPTGGTPLGGTPTEFTNAETPHKDAFAYGLAVDSACYYQKLSGSACEASDASNGDVYVTVPQENAVDKFRQHEGKWEYVCQFVGWGFVGKACLKNSAGREAEPEELEFKSPEGVAVDTQGNVYITGAGPANTMAAYEFDASGNQVSKIISGVSGQANAVAVDGAGDVFMTPPGRGQMVEMKRLGPGSYEQQPLTNATGGILASDMETGHIFTVNSEWRVIEYNSKLEYITTVTEGLPEDGARVPNNIFLPEVLATNDKANAVLTVGYPEPERVVQTFGPGPIIPDVELLEPQITAKTITVHGTVNPDGTTVTSCKFELLAVNYQVHQEQPCTVGPGSTPQTISAEFTEVIAKETILARLSASNENGTNTTPALQWATPAAPPSIKETEVQAITRTSALLSGMINPENTATTYHFVFGKTAAYGSTTASIGAGQTGFEQLVTSKVEGLQPGTTYHFALVAENAIGTTTGPDVEFTTAPRLVPSVSDVTVSGLEPGAALISGIVTSGGLPTNYEIDFGPDTSYVTRLTGEVLGEQARVELNLIYLIPNTTYHYRIVVRNEDGVAESPDQTFTTPLYPLKIPQILPQVSALIAPFPSEEIAYVYKPAKHKATKGKKHKKHKRHHARKKHKRK